jgi:hypothetical protein
VIAVLIDPAIAMRAVRNVFLSTTMPAVDAPPRARRLATTHYSPLTLALERTRERELDCREIQMHGEGESQALTSHHEA